MRVLITGSRYWIDRERIHQALWHTLLDHDGVPSSIIVIHGAASGADTLAGNIASTLGMQVESYPANWGRYGKRAGPIRNQQMVDLGADICLAFPEFGSRGTVHCMNIANLAEIPVVNWGYPDIEGLYFEPTAGPPEER